MLTTLVVLLRSIGLICRGHRAVALENLALRQQLAALTRTVKRPRLRGSDRLFWILLAKGWREWRSALIVVQPDTVLRWHRQWLRRQWTRRSVRVRPGRPSTDAAIRTLVSKMAAANPLWGAPRIHGELGKLGVKVADQIGFVQVKLASTPAMACFVAHEPVVTVGRRRTRVARVHCTAFDA